MPRYMIGLLLALLFSALYAYYYTGNFHPVKPLFYNLLNFFYEGLLLLYFQRETSIAHRDWRVKPLF